MTELGRRSWDDTSSIPRTSRSLRAAAVWVGLIVVTSLLVSAGAGQLSPFTTKADPALTKMAAAHPASRMSVIVRETNPASLDAERRVWALGGHVTHQLPIIGSFSARLPGAALGSLLNSPAVSRVWGDGHLRTTYVDMAQYDDDAPDTAWRQTIQTSSSGPLPVQPGGGSANGLGVTVAVLDTGISQSPDLGNRVLARVDFTPEHDGYDRFGHGTHMAGIIAGDGTASNGQWVGVAPKANLVSVKVARGDGSTDVSVVIAAMQWLVTHKAQYNIRVLNLSYGTDSKQSYVVDPLNYAVEQVWRSGIFVAVAAGNVGPDQGSVNKPGDDPLVVTVGGADSKNTPGRDDDTIAPFSSRGPTQDGLSKPDLVAPSISIVSLRAAGSTIDQAHPAARLGEHYFKGTGTSQATAIVSGIAANMFSTAPTLTPDLVKAIITRTAYRGITSQAGSGSGLVDANAALAVTRRSQFWGQPANQGVVPSTGLGSLEASRGSRHVYADLDHDGDMELVEGEVDVLGNSWTGNSWTGNSWTGNEWCSYVFEGIGWLGNSWSGNSWSGTSWSGNEWTGNSWTGNSWTGNEWSGNSWS
jgi:serine protease AprX